MKMIDPSLRAHLTHQPYAGPASAFRNSPPASALPWPKSFKSSTPKSKSQTIDDSPYTIPASRLEIGKQTAAISPHSKHETTTIKGKTTETSLKPAQTDEQQVAHHTLPPKPTTNSKFATPRVDKYGRIQHSGSPLEKWTRRAAETSTTTTTTSQRSPVPKTELPLPPKPTARRMTQNWRSPIIETPKAVQAKSDSSNDDDDKTLVDGDEGCLNVVQLDKLYVFVTDFLKW